MLICVLFHSKSLLLRYGNVLLRCGVCEKDELGSARIMKAETILTLSIVLGFLMNNGHTCRIWWFRARTCADRKSLQIAVCGLPEVAGGIGKGRIWVDLVVDREAEREVWEEMRLQGFGTVFRVEMRLGEIEECTVLRCCEIVRRSTYSLAMLPPVQLLVWLNIVVVHIK